MRSICSDFFFLFCSLRTGILVRLVPFGHLAASARYFVYGAVELYLMTLFFLSVETTGYWRHPFSEYPPNLLKANPAETSLSTAKPPPATSSIAYSKFVDEVDRSFAPVENGELLEIL